MAAGLSQLEIAKRAGVTRQTINAIENDKYDPSLGLAFSVGHILGVTVDTLFDPGSPAPEPRGPGGRHAENKGS